MKLIAPYTMLLLALVSEVAATPTPNPNPTEPELGLVPREEKEMIIITIIDCNPNINFKDYRLLCNSPDPVNFCEAHQPAIPQTSSPPDPPRSGSVGLENPLQLGSAVIPEGCDPDAEDAGPAGILHVAVGTEMTVGIVWFPDAEHGGGSRASVSYEDVYVASILQTGTVLTSLTVGMYFQSQDLSRRFRDLLVVQCPKGGTRDQRCIRS